MTTAPMTPNPFALMLNPEAIFAALAGSDHLARLQSRVCRPLDKPVIVRTSDDGGDDFDADAPDEKEVGRDE